LSVDNIATFCLAYLVFIAATVTDYYDGKIARAQNIVTNFGKLLDPVADKVLMVAAFVMLAELDGLSIPGWALVVIIAREFLVTGARSLAASEGAVIAANRWGKTKTVIQMVYVFTFLFFVIVERALHFWYPGGIELYSRILAAASYWGIVFVVVYTAYSGVRFAKLNWAVLNLRNL